MSTLAWTLVIWVAIQIPYQFYLVDRPRERKTLLEAFGATIEAVLIMWAVIEIATGAR